MPSRISDLPAALAAAAGDMFELETAGGESRSLTLATLGVPLVQYGRLPLTFPGSTSEEQFSVTFPTPFSAPPAFCVDVQPWGASGRYNVHAYSSGETAGNIWVASLDGSDIGAGQTPTASWIAVGPR